MKRLKNLLNTTVYFNKRTLERSLIFAIGFGLGATSLPAALFFAVFWYIGEFIGGKLYAAWNK